MSNLENIETVEQVEKDILGGDAQRMYDENGREIEISLDFLPEGKFTLTSFEDGVNADRLARDYKKSVREVNASQKLTLKMAREGGWVGKFDPVK